MEFGVEDHPRVCFRESRLDESLGNRRPDLLSTRGIDREGRSLLELETSTRRIPLGVSCRSDDRLNESRFESKNYIDRAL